MKKNRLLIIFLFVILLASCNENRALFICDNYYDEFRCSYFNVDKILKEEFANYEIKTKKIVVTVNSKEIEDISLIMENNNCDIYILSPLLSKNIAELSQKFPDKKIVLLETIKDYDISNVFFLKKQIITGIDELAKLFVSLDGVSIQRNKEEIELKNNRESEVEDLTILQKVENFVKSFFIKEEEIVEDENEEVIEAEFEEAFEDLEDPFMPAFDFSKLEFFSVEEDNIEIKPAFVWYNKSNRASDEADRFITSYNNFKDSDQEELAVFELDAIDSTTIYNKSAKITNGGYNLLFVQLGSGSTEFLTTLASNNVYTAAEMIFKSTKYETSFFKTSVFSLEYDYNKGIQELVSNVVGIENISNGIILDGIIKKSKNHSILYDKVADKEVE